MKQTRQPRFHSACPHDCPSTCALEVEVIDGRRVGRVYGAQDNDYTAGTVCAKVGRYAERIHHPDRLTQPLRRTGQKGLGLSAFTPISWDDALDEIATRFSTAMDQFGSETLWPYHYAGTMGLVQRDGLERFRHLLKTSRMHGTFCVTLADAGWNAGVGAKRGSDPRTIADSELVVVWGNPVSTQVNLMHHITRARRERGAKLVVIDPYRTPTADKADQHLMLRPGTDGALACAVMHVLFRDGFADRDYLKTYTDVPDEFEAHLQTRTPQWAADITGLSADEIVSFAHLYGKTKRSFIRLGYGFSRSRNGAVNVHAVTCLPAVTGAWKHRGGGALYSNLTIYPVDQRLITASDCADYSTRVLDQSRIGEVLTGNPHDLQGGPPVTAMLIQNTNPIVVAPDTLKVKKGLEREDLFVCVHEQFMTETAAMADIVLPATMFLEHDDLYRAGGHTYLQTTRKLLEPPGECRSNHRVLNELLQRMGVNNPQSAVGEREIIDKTLRLSGLPDEQTLFDKHWHECAFDFERSNFLAGFGTPDKKFHFKPDWSRVGPNVEGLPPMPDYMPVLNPTDQEHPFRLVAAPARNFLNTSFTETPTSINREKRPTLLVHPADAATLALENGSRVRLGNRQGSVVLHAKIFDGLQVGVVVAESIWPSSAFEEGVGINALISAEPGKPNGGAVFHDTAVWLLAC